MTADLLPLRLIHALATLYMMLILLNWLGPWMEFDIRSGRFAWIARLTDPLVDAIRKRMPSLGPVDFAPMAAVLSVWILREVIVRVVAQSMT